MKFEGTLSDFNLKNCYLNHGALVIEFSNWISRTPRWQSCLNVT